MTPQHFANTLCRYSVIFFSIIAVAGCLPSSESETAEKLPADDNPSSQNSVPVISGNPSSEAQAGSEYSFQPSASDPDGDALTFSITGLPSWASFSETTGQISGTPGGEDVGTYNGISITVSDGEDSATLSPFSITVNDSGNANNAPEISGSPNSQVLAGTNYSFQPTASDADGDSLIFTVEGLPSWANFSEANGRISGTPSESDIGTYDDISIIVSDGTDSATLGPFSITVSVITLGSATLSWTPPTQNTDGTALTDLAGYRIYYGTSSGSYTESVTLDNAGLSSYVVEGLLPGEWYFVSTAINEAGVESAYSNEAVKTVM